MNPLTVTLVIEPPSLPTVGLQAPARKTFAYDEFAAALSASLGFTVDVLEAPLADAAEKTPGLLVVNPGEGFYDYLASVRGLEVRKRIFLLDANRTSVLGILERFSLAGAIETYRYFRWQTERANEFGGQVYGRRALVAQAGGAISEAFASEHYALFDAPGTTDLPSATAWYIREYSARASAND